MAMCDLFYFTKMIYGYLALEVSIKRELNIKNKKIFKNYNRKNS
jgi:hypothetical protein